MGLNQPVQLRYFIRDITTALLTYNRIRWHRSVDGPNGIYEARTQNAPTIGSLLGSLVEPHQVNGRTLKFLVNGTDEVSVVFASADPVSTVDVVSEIIAATPLVTPSDSSGYLKIDTIQTGTAATIEILDGDANPFLGFEEGDKASGQDQDTLLIVATHEYFFTDQSSDREYWYKVELLHDTEGVTTGLGVPFPANLVDAVPAAQTLVGYIRLADLRGYPIEGRKVTIHNTFLPNSAAGFGIFRHSIDLTTDRNGYAEVRLIRGMEVDVSIDGTGFVRRIAIPTTGDAVDLLDPSLVTRDEFGIHEADIDFAIRTS